MFVQRRPAPGGAGRITSRVAALSVGFTMLSVSYPSLAEAHGIEGRAALPVPAWVFAWAAAIVLVLSFVALSALWSSPRLQEPRLRRLLGLPPGLPLVCGAIGLALFALVIWAGYDGVGGVAAQTQNWDPTFIYIIFWVGVPITSAVTGDWFSAFSPWRAVARRCAGSPGEPG